MPIGAMATSTVRNRITEQLPGNAKPAPEEGARIVVNRQELLSDLKRVLRQLEADLRQRAMNCRGRCGSSCGYDAAKEGGTYCGELRGLESWLRYAGGGSLGAQLRLCSFLEDNQLVDPPRISGPGERLRRARDEYDLYVRQYPAHTYREYLLSVFDRISQLPAAEKSSAGMNPIHQHAAGSAAMPRGSYSISSKNSSRPPATLSTIWRSELNTRFLGDLYQDLSEESPRQVRALADARVARSYSDRTSIPALRVWIDGFRMIDPACGSGHFLLGSLHRIYDGGSERNQERTPSVGAESLG